MGVRFAVLGPIRATAGGRELESGPVKRRMALLMLLLNANRVVPLRYHCEALWHEPPVSARSNLRTYVSALRRALRALAPELDDRITWREVGYRIAVAPDELDLAEFDRLAAAGEAQLGRGDPAAAAGTLRAALDLWQPPEVCAERCGPRLELLLAALTDRYFAVMDHYLDAELLCGRDGALVPMLWRRIAEHPTNERLWCRLMVALTRAGDMQRGLAAYRDACRRLDTELGTTPGAELRWVHRAILSQDPRISGAAGLPWLGVAG